MDNLERGEIEGERDRERGIERVGVVKMKSKERKKII